MNEGVHKNHVNFNFELIEIHGKCSACGKDLEGVFDFSQYIPVVIIEPCLNCIQKYFNKEKK